MSPGRRHSNGERQRLVMLSHKTQSLRAFFRLTQSRSFFLFSGCMRQILLSFYPYPVFLVGQLGHLKKTGLMH
ncbi:hypothetical protein ACCAA_1230003 [Candidatus Accumulibacter aalborgensis]|uniref:Uncharacterized protein n=1 Tax=Candidatus Accumulibacter aalborgensis TaxID=1860102 RepID=A0A1A8XHW9_9PROT|nr:hypothetical protein ACCAA_1230003 [Candidatus Accumulibacter aalborgensis]